MPRAPRIEPDREVVARVGATALSLPEAYEQDAWTGVRWRIRSSTFAHVLVSQPGWTSSYRDATGIAAPTTVLTFRSEGEELQALEHAGHPFYKPDWSPVELGLVLDDHTDWSEVAELVTESYLLLAPRKLVRRVRPDR